MLRELLEEAADLSRLISLGEQKIADRKAQHERRENKVATGHPVGTKLYRFFYDDGINTVTTVGESEVMNDCGDIRFFDEEDRSCYSTTVDGAINLAIANSKSADGDFDEFCEEIESNVNYYKDRLAMFENAMRLVKETE